MMRLNIGGKLLLAFALLILGFGGLLFTTLERFVSLQASEEAQFEQHYERISAVKELRINIAAQRSEVLLAINQGSEAELDKHEEEIRQRSAINDRLVKQLQQAVSDDGEASELLEQLLLARKQMADTRTTQLQMIRAGQLDEALQLSKGAQLDRFERIHELGLQLAALTEQRIAAALEHSRQSLEALRERIRNLSLLLVGGSAVLAWLLSRHIAAPLARLTAWAEQIGRGEIPREVSGSPRQDEVGRLAQAFVEMS
ncbi:MAG TPA: MCP four helix bundle domain-containing protein, partial [Pseudomonas sp.]|nr:MCP four helix bundle domain-containing protein [Pseudomonas sp.]